MRMCALMSLCMCVRGTGCLAQRGVRGKDRREEEEEVVKEKRGAQQGECVWVPKHYHLEMV